MKIKYLSLTLMVYIVFGLFGIFSAFLPYPYGYIGVVELVIGLLLLIALGHRSAFRQHGHGIISQWTNPKAFVAMKLDAKERYLVNIGLVMVVSSLFSYLLLLIIKPQ